MISDEGKYGVLHDVVDKDRTGPNENVEGDDALSETFSDLDEEALDEMDKVADERVKEGGRKSDAGGKERRVMAAVETFRMPDPQPAFQPQVHTLDTLDDGCL